jgi:hypothetical protein
VPKAILDDDSHDYESENSREVQALADDVNRAIRNGDTPKLMRYFEDVLDNLHTSPSSSVWSQIEREESEAADTHEREKIERQEAEFKQALVDQCNQSLASHGIRIVRVVESGERDGFLIFARDRVGRTYEARLPFTLADEKIAIYGQEGFVRRMFDDVVREILTAKDRYFARMQ